MFHGAGRDTWQGTNRANKIFDRKSLVSFAVNAPQQDCFPFAANLLWGCMTENQNHPGERIAKVIARAGLCSRRDAEVWVADGRVAVNGKKLDSPAFNVQPGDTITVDGAPLAQRERTRLFFFHKPRGTVTTAHDPEGRMTVFDALPKDLPRVVTVGRLDINTEGLLLLTNDGGLARALELPSTGWLRRYRVRAHGRTDQARLDELAKGLTIDGINYRGIEARLDREQGSNVWLTIGLREGKNREVRKVMEHIGLEVNRLIRVSFGPFQLGELEEGAVEEVKTRILKDQLGDKIANLANADFDAPLFGESADSDRVPKGRAQGDRSERSGAFVPSREQRSFTADTPADPDAPRESPKPGKRRHISTLREDAKARIDKDGERRRIERGQTADRSGRPVAIERVVAPGRKSPRVTYDDAKPARRSTRNARNFAALANPDAAPRSPARSPGDRPRQRTGGADNSGFDARPARPFRDGPSPRREGPSPRRDGESPRREGQRPTHDGTRSFRGNDGDRPRRDGPPTARRDDRSGRPDRSFGAKSNAGGERDNRDSKFKRPDRDFAPRGRRAEFSDPVVPDRIPWGAPQDGAGSSDHARNRPDRDSGKFRSGQRPDAGSRTGRPAFRPKREDGRGGSRGRDGERSGSFASRADPPYRDFSKPTGGRPQGSRSASSGGKSSDARSTERSGNRDSVYARPAGTGGYSGGRSDERPRGQSSGKSFDKPAGRSFDKPFGRQGEKPGGKPGGGKPDGKTFAKPGGRPPGKPFGKPSGKPGGGYGGKSSGGGRPASRPGGFKPGGFKPGGFKPGGGNRGPR